MNIRYPLYEGVYRILTFRNMERVQRLSASPGYQAGICKAYPGDKKAGGHTGNPVH